MSRNSLSLSWRSNDEVNVRHLLVVEHESVPDQSKKGFQKNFRRFHLAHTGLTFLQAHSESSGRCRPLSKRGLNLLPAVSLVSLAAAKVLLGATCLPAIILVVVFLCFIQLVQLDETFLHLHLAAAREAGGDELSSHGLLVPCPASSTLVTSQHDDLSDTD